MNHMNKIQVTFTHCYYIYCLCMLYIDDSNLYIFTCFVLKYCTYSNYLKGENELFNVNNVIKHI